MKGQKFITAIAFVFAFVCSSLTVYAVAPANDNFANAQTIVIGSGVIQTNNSEATKEATEPNHALNAGGRSIWYKYVATGEGSLQASTGGSLFDTTLAIYRGTSLGTLQLIAFSDDIVTGSNFQSRVEIGTYTGTTYYIAVDGKSTDGVVASGIITLDVTTGTVPVNDAFANAITLSSLGGMISVSNVNATKETGEPNHGGDVGGHSVWYRFVGPPGMSKSRTFSTRGSRTQLGLNSIPVLLGVYTGVSVNNLTPVVSDNGTAQVTFTPVAGTVYYIALDTRSAAQLPNEQGTIVLRYGITDSTEDADFEGDNIPDISVFRPSTGTWYSIDSITGQPRSINWGLSTDIPLAADLDHDGKADQTVFRPDTGTWYSNMSKPPFGMIAFQWGVSGDIPQVYREGLFEWAAVFRPSDGTWYIKYLNTPITVRFGLAGDIPVMADYDGDGTTDVAVFRPLNGTWYRLNSSNGQFFAQHFGVIGDIPAVGDYDNDGRADLAVFRPSTGTWYVLRSYTGSVLSTQWGIPGDTPQAADYDGDNRADFAVFRPSNGVWYVLRSSTGTARFTAFGQTGDKPVTALNYVQ